MSLEIDSKQLVELGHKHGLKALVLFGSQATGRTHAKSDVDIAYLADVSVDKYHLATELSHAYKRDDIELIDLGKASPTLMVTVVENGKLLYESSPGSFFRWKVYAMKIWMETAWLRDMRREAMLKWARSI